MKKSLVIIPIILALGISAYIGVFYYKNLRGVKPAITNPPYPIANVINTSSTNPLSLPSGFNIEVFAQDLSGARVIAFDRYGNLWVSRPGEGKISVVVVQGGKVVKTIDVMTGLDQPHGLLFDYTKPDVLYIAEESKVSSVLVKYTEANEPEIVQNTDLIKLVDLPHEVTARHTTRTLAYTSKGEILLSIGSSCNVCHEESLLHASIQKLEKVGDIWRLTPYATGLRNSVFMTTNPVNGKLWATEMGRDELGDNIPPDELNIIEEGKNYGWPICYGNKIHDVQFDTNTYIMDPCAKTVASTYDLPAHVAPLGLAFIPEESFWPEDYWNDLLVAYHGSWNRSIPVGYSIERIMLNDQGQIVGEQPFIEGWLTRKNEALGRPVDLVFMNRSLYISDDRAGVVYRVSFTEEKPPQTDDQVVVDGFVSGGTAGSTPLDYDVSTTTVSFSGHAKGTMFFEASFPVTAVDEYGVIVGQGIAQAEGDWMTEGDVPFTVVLTKVDDPTIDSGTLLFKKDNPSGLPKYEYTYTIPITFVGQ